MILTETVEQQALALWAAMAAAAGDAPHPSVARAEFDRMLFAEPLAPADSELRDALGVL